MNRGIDKTLTIFATITCPHCGFKKEEEMETEACRYFYTCEKCNAVLKPNVGDCCVFCSYGSEKCPPVQLTGSCC
ncbi:MAG TPA: GDCCVxC domain-containing (seleno)protein [Flavisolibacter sp.]|nr:GDCCVxC domain-containing (seleno)protein [Flavisolibacter sp.]